MSFTAFATARDPSTTDTVSRAPLKRSLSRVLGNQPWEVAPACRHVHGFLEDHGLSARALHAADLVVEEMVRNITQYAYGDSGGAVRVDVEVSEKNVTFTFTDHGRAFDPSRHPEPEPAVRLADAPVGGLGLRLVRRAAAALYYRRLPGANRTVVIVAR